MEKLVRVLLPVLAVSGSVSAGFAESPAPIPTLQPGQSVR